MEDLKAKADNLIGSISEYAKTYYKLKILNVADKATSIAAGALAGISILFLGIFVLFFLGIALGAWLGELLNSYALGFLLVAVLFILIILILVLMRKRIVFPLMRNLIIKKLYE